MTAVSSTTLIADARRYADQRQSTFFTDSEVRRIINQQIAEYYDLLVSVRGHEYYATSDEITLSAGTTAYSLPADFYQMLSVDLVWASDDREPIPALNHQQDIHRYLNRDDWARYSGKAYRLNGSANRGSRSSGSSVSACRKAIRSSRCARVSVNPRHIHQTGRLSRRAVAQRPEIPQPRGPTRSAASRRHDPNRT